MAEPEFAKINQVAEVSLNSVAGLTTPRTLEMKGKIEDQEVMTLIDPSATHNFISKALAERAHLSINKTGSYGVTLGTGRLV